MLRITTFSTSDVMTFQLEGRLAGPWVAEVDRCAQYARLGSSRYAIRFDLSNVTYIDAAGQELLKKLHQSGAEFVAEGCLMRAVVEEIALT